MLGECVLAKIIFPSSPCFLSFFFFFDCISPIVEENILLRKDEFGLPQL